jgi:hypothetical protein
MARSRALAIWMSPSSIAAIVEQHDRHLPSGEEVRLPCGKPGAAAATGGR